MMQRFMRMGSVLFAALGILTVALGVLSFHGTAEASVPLSFDCTADCGCVNGEGNDCFDDSFPIPECGCCTCSTVQTCRFLGCQ